LCTVYDDPDHTVRGAGVHVVFDVAPSFVVRTVYYTTNDCTGNATIYRVNGFQHYLRNVNPPIGGCTVNYNVVPLGSRLGGKSFSWIWNGTYFSQTDCDGNCSDGLRDQWKAGCSGNIVKTETVRTNTCILKDDLPEDHFPGFATPLPDDARSIFYETSETPPPPAPPAPTPAPEESGTSQKLGLLSLLIGSAMLTWWI